jgi:hypothetical protein
VSAPKRFLKALKALKALAQVIHMHQERYYQDPVRYCYQDID